MPPRSYLDDAPGMIPIPPLGIAHLSSFLKDRGYVVSLDDLDIKIIADKKSYGEWIRLQTYSQDDLDNFLTEKQPNYCLEAISNILLEKIDFYSHDIIGFSLIESSALCFALILSKAIKEKTGATIIFGGSCADPHIAKKYSFVDYVVTDDKPEYELLSIIHKIENKKPIKSFSISPKPIPDFSGLPIDCYKNVPEQNQFKNMEYR